MNDSRSSDPRSGGSGIGRDLRSVRDNGTASLRELREFVTQLKGQRPQEVMGIVTGNGLVQAVLISTCGIALLLVTFTAIPFLLAEDEPVAGTSTTPKAVSQPVSPASSSAGTATDKPEPVRADTANNNVSDALGIGETKTSSSEENPLENKLDNLLDDLK